MRLRRVRDEKLASVGSRPRVRHGKRSGHVPVRVTIHLVGEAIPRATPPVAVRAPPLNDKPGDHTVELQPVVEPVLREKHKIVHGNRRILREQLKTNVAARGADFRMVAYRRVNTYRRRCGITPGHHCSFEGMDDW